MCSQTPLATVSCAIRSSLLQEACTDGLKPLWQQLCFRSCHLASNLNTHHENMLALQALVEHYSAAGHPEVVERAVLHMDVASLDLNQVSPSASPPAPPGLGVSKILMLSLCLIMSCLSWLISLSKQWSIILDLYLACRWDNG